MTSLPAEDAVVLLVDDEPAMLTALRRALTTPGWRFLTATGGKQALAILRDQPVHVILSDLDMPEMNGLELLCRARTAAPTAVRIVLTGRLGAEIALRAINEGEVHRYLVKPFDTAALRLAIGEALERQRTVARLEDASRRDRAHRQRLTAIERLHPGISHVERTPDGDYPIDAPAILDYAARVGMDFLLADD